MALTEVPKPRRAGSAAAVALIASALAAAGLISLVTLADPGTREQELFVGLLLVLGAGIACSALLLLSPRSDSPLADMLRALRRGVLFGLACSGAVVLQLNGAFTAPNLAFLLLMLLIFEMVFLARRQNPA